MTLYYAVPLAGTLPSLLLAWVVRTIITGQLVPRSWVESRVGDRDLLILARDATIAEQAAHIRILEANNDVLLQGNRTTLQVVKALPAVALPDPDPLANEAL